MAHRVGAPGPLLGSAWVAAADLRTFLLRPKTQPLLRPVYYGEEVDWGAVFRDMGGPLERRIASLAAHPVLDDVARCATAGVLLAEPFDRVPFPIDGRPVHLWAAPGVRCG